MVDGMLLVTPEQFDRLREAAVVSDGHAFAFGIPVVVVPDDGTPKDLGNGKVAVYYKRVFPDEFIVFPREVLNFIGGPRAHT
jgi:hypothetical protein